MKKNFKKLFAILMTVAVVLSMAMPALAAEESFATKGDYQLIIEAQTAFDHAVEYDVYQLLVANIDSTGAAVYSSEGAQNASMLTADIKDIDDTEQDSEFLWNLVKEMKTTKQIPYKTSVTKTTGEDPVKYYSEVEIKQAGYYLAVPKNLAEASGLEGGIVSSPILVAVPSITKKVAEDGYDVGTTVTVQAKDSEVSTDKAITGVESVNGESGTYSKSGNTATLGEGDTITYTITNTVPTYRENVEAAKVNYYVVDEYDANLQLEEIKVIAPENFEETIGENLKETPVTAMNGDTYTAYGVNGEKKYVVEKDTNKFTVYFNYGDVAGQKEVVIQAKFKLKDSALPGKENPIDNKSTLYYTNNYYTGTDSPLEDQVESWTFKFDVYKYTEDEENPGGFVALPGAEFTLYKTNNDGELSDPIGKQPATSDANGLVDFGLDLNAGTYYVKETKAPNGYRVDDTIYTVVITPTTDPTSNEYTGEAEIKVNGETIGTTIDDITETFDNPTFGVKNTHGQTLPGTGGIGTTIFTFGGLALIVLAGILLVVYTRKQKKA